jgi:DNA-damage-inducible protein J
MQKWQYNGIQRDKVFMSQNAYIRTRTNTELKARAEAVFAQLGINMTDAINMFLAQVALRSGLPFDVVLPQTDAYTTEQSSAEVLKQALNNAIDQAQADFEAGRVVTPEQSKARTRAKLLALQASKPETV